MLPLKTLTTTWSRRTSPPAATSVGSQIATGSSFGSGSVSAPQPQTAATSTSAASTARVSADLRAPRHRVGLVDPGVEDAALLERGPEGAVETVLEVEVALPLHDVGEEVAVEGGVLVEQGVELEGVLGGHQLVEPHLARGQVGPGARGQPVVGVGPAEAHPLEDHAGDHNDGATRPLVVVCRRD